MIGYAGHRAELGARRTRSALIVPKGASVLPYTVGTLPPTGPEWPLTPVARQKTIVSAERVDSPTALYVLTL